MKKAFSILMIVALALSVTHCSKKKEGKRAVRRGNGNGQAGLPDQNLNRNGNVSTFSNTCNIPTNIPLNGVIDDSRSESVYRNELIGFLSPLGDLGCETEDSLCLQFVSNKCDATTGVRFSGKVQTAQPIHPGGMNSAQAVSGSIAVIVFDQLSADNPNEVPGIGAAAQLDPSRSSVSGNMVNLTFTWECGYIYLNGQIQNQFVYGELKYAGNGACMNSTGAGSLGQMSVPTCNAQYGLFTNCN